jgi:hypothetical protein
VVERYNLTVKKGISFLHQYEGTHFKHVKEVVALAMALAEKENSPITSLWRRSHQILILVMDTSHNFSAILRSLYALVKPVYHTADMQIDLVHENISFQIM